MKSSKQLTPGQKAHGQLLAADPAACAVLNDLARILRVWRMQRRAAA